MNTLRRIFYGALPLIALGVFFETLVYCLHVARANGHHVDDFTSSDPPPISLLGTYEPEHTWFSRGFTLLVFVMLLTFVIRRRGIANTPRVLKSRALRIANHAAMVFALFSMIALLLMAWIPGDQVSHFIAAMATFGFLALYEFVHGAITMTITKHKILCVWFFLCPIGAMTFVYLWITAFSMRSQHIAVALQFAYFLPLSWTLAQSQTQAQTQASSDHVS